MRRFRRPSWVITRRVAITTRDASSRPRRWQCVTRGPGGRQGRGVATLLRARGAGTGVAARSPFRHRPSRRAGRFLCNCDGVSSCSSEASRLASSISPIRRTTLWKFWKIYVQSMLYKITVWWGTQVLCSTLRSWCRVSLVNVPRSVDNNSEISFEIFVVFPLFAFFYFILGIIVSCHFA